MLADLVGEGIGLLMRANRKATYAWSDAVDLRISAVGDGGTRAADLVGAGRGCGAPLLADDTFARGDDVDRCAGQAPGGAARRWSIGTAGQLAALLGAADGSCSGRCCAGIALLLAIWSSRCITVRAVAGTKPRRRTPRAGTRARRIATALTAERRSRRRPGRPAGSSPCRARRVRAGHRRHGWQLEVAGEIRGCRLRHGPVQRSSRNCAVGRWLPGSDGPGQGTKDLGRGAGIGWRRRGHARVTAVGTLHVVVDGRVVDPSCRSANCSPPSTPKDLGHFAAAANNEGAHVPDDADYRHAHALEHRQRLLDVGQGHLLLAW